MMKHIRTLSMGLFMVSMLALSSCRNNCYDNFDRCDTRKVPACDQPCAPSPTCGTKPYKSEPICAAPRAVQKASFGTNGQAPSSSETNPFCPCNPTAFPCGNGQNPVPEAACYKNMKTYNTCDECVVDLTQRAPEFATVGSAYPIEIIITARRECADVTVNQKLPCDSAFVRSEPAVTPNADNTVSWHFPHMVKGETQKIVVWVKPQKEGCCLAEATICACPQLCAYTNCGQPVLCIKKSGPACACLYCPVQYRIDVSNSGSATAHDVVVQDTVPDGLTHASGYKSLTYQLGDLGPGECRTLNVDFSAAKRGMTTNTATVSYCGGPKCSAEASTLINEPCVHVTKTGPDWAYICKTVDYTITVTNPGDLILRDVVVEDISPAGTTICAAPGAEICCNKAVWTLPELCPGETKTFCISVKSQVTGTLTNKVMVTSQSDCGTCSMCAEAATCWKGIAATHMCMVDMCDPICIGETTVYRICVTNRGTADDTNVRLTVKFTNELQPQTVNGPTAGNINGQTVTFEPLGVLAPKGCVEYSIVVKGVAVGDAKAEAELNTDTLSSPDTEVESTHVY